MKSFLPYSLPLDALMKMLAIIVHLFVIGVTKNQLPGFTDKALASPKIKSMFELF